MALSDYKGINTHGYFHLDLSNQKSIWYSASFGSLRAAVTNSYAGVACVADRMPRRLRPNGPHWLAAGSGGPAPGQILEIRRSQAR